MKKHASILKILPYLSIGALSLASASYAGIPVPSCNENPVCAQLLITNQTLTSMLGNQSIINNNIGKLINNTDTLNIGLNDTKSMLAKEYQDEQQQRYYSSTDNGHDAPIQWDNALDKSSDLIDQAISGMSSNKPPSSFPALVQLLLGANGADSLQMQLIFKDLLTPPDTQNEDYPDTAFTAMGNTLMRNITPSYQGEIPTGGSDTYPPALYGDASATRKAYADHKNPVGMFYSQLAPENTINADLLLPMSKTNQFNTLAKKLLALPFNDTQPASLTDAPVPAPTVARQLLAKTGVPTGFPEGPNPLVSDALTADFTPLQKKRQVFISNDLFPQNPRISAQAACFALGGAVIATIPSHAVGNPYTPGYGVRCEYYPYMAQRDISTTYLSGMGVVPSVNALQMTQLASSKKSEDQQIFMNAKSSMRTNQAWRAFAQSNIAHTVLDNVVSADQGGDASKSSDQQQSGDPFEARIVGAHGWLKGVNTATPTELLRELVREHAVQIYQNAKASKATQTTTISQSVLIAELATLNQTMMLNGVSMALKIASSTPTS
jgi:hypothetical protein